MDNNKFRNLYPLQNRNDEYMVDSDRCDRVLNDITEQENFIQRVKEDKQKSDKQKVIDDTRLYQLTILEKLLDSECTGLKHIELIHEIFNMLNTGMTDESDSKINKQIKKKLQNLLNSRLRSTRRNNLRQGGKSRRRKFKRTRRMRR